MTDTLDRINERLRGSMDSSEKVVLDQFFKTKVPALITAGEALVKPPFSVGEVTTLIRVVSEAVADGAGILRNEDKREVVKAVVRFIAQTFLTGKSLVLDLLASDFILNGVVDFVYGLAVKPYAKKYFVEDGGKKYLIGADGQVFHGLNGPAYVPPGYDLNDDGITLKPYPDDPRLKTLGN